MLIIKSEAENSEKGTIFFKNLPRNWIILHYIFF